MGDDIKKVFERIEDALKDTGRDYMEENAPEPEGDDSVDKIIDGMVDWASEKVYPCVPLRGVTIFPNTVIHFDIGRDKSIKALESAMARDKILFVTSQKDDNILIPTFEEIGAERTKRDPRYSLSAVTTWIYSIITPAPPATECIRSANAEFSCTKTAPRALPIVAWTVAPTQRLAPMK